MSGGEAGGHSTVGDHVPQRGSQGRFPASGRYRRLGLTLVFAGLLGLSLTVVLHALHRYPPAQGLVLEDGRLLGGDFAAFYLGGRLARETPGSLYDLNYQREAMEAILGEDRHALGGDLPFVYPPLVAALLAPLASLDFLSAYLVWVILGLTVTLAALFLLWRSQGDPGIAGAGMGLLGVVGFVPFSVNTLAGGQAAWMGVLVFALVGWAALSGRPVLAGLFMALGYYKPPLFLFASLYLALRMGRPFLLGCLIGASAMTLGTVALVGFDGLGEYLLLASGYRYGTELMEGVELPPSMGVGLFALLTQLLPEGGLAWPGLLMAMGLGLIPAWLRGRERAPRPVDRLEMAYAMILSVALSVQVLPYDLALLMVAFLLILIPSSRSPGTSHPLAVAGVTGFYLEFLARGIGAGSLTLQPAWIAFALLVTGLILGLRRGDRGSQSPVPSASKYP